MPDSRLYIEWPEFLDQLVDLILTNERHIFLRGPVGSGKSTLLQILGGLDRPDSGRVLVNGEDIHALPEQQRAGFRSNDIGFVFQFHHLLPDFTALENVLIPGLIAGSKRRVAEARAAELLSRVGLSERVTHRPAELSGGERQRVGVARALICQPKLVLADEPTGNLDHSNAMAIGKLLVDLQKRENAMLVLVTHSSELASLIERQLQLADGVLRE